MKFTSHRAFFGLATLASAANLATTTRYYDGQEGACGCGTSSGNYGWQPGITTGVYTAAGSQALFDTDGATWCGGGCGKCYNLTSTGSSACSTCGAGETAGASIIVMVTNLCPFNGNEQWCPNVGGTNEYGYSYHFDIMAQSEVFGDNPVVEFEPVACPGQATTDWEQCVCYGETATDETPEGLTTGSEPATTSSTTFDVEPATTSSTTEANIAEPTLTSKLSASDPIPSHHGKVPSTLSTVAANSASTTASQNHVCRASY